ncbi:unnamed protein product [Symbiodinium sp. CCMP2592]|nr:unnamed protein product [Symbiodinium sp. CCMP2592]
MWKHFDSSSTSWQSEVSATVFVIDDPLITVTLQQGVAPQLFALLSTVGGYISLTSLIFTTIFVKKYPNSAIAILFQKRTLFGRHKPGEPDSELEDAALSSVTPADPRSQTMGKARELPELPPGMILPPAASKRTE